MWICPQRAVWVVYFLIEAVKADSGIVTPKSLSLSLLVSYMIFTVPEQAIACLELMTMPGRSGHISQPVATFLPAETK